MFVLRNLNDLNYLGTEVQYNYYGQEVYTALQTETVAEAARLFVRSSALTFGFNALWLIHAHHTHHVVLLVIFSTFGL